MHTKDKPHPSDRCLSLKLVYDVREESIFRPSLDSGALITVLKRFALLLRTYPPSWDPLVTSQHWPSPRYRTMCSSQIPVLSDCPVGHYVHIKQIDDLPDSELYHQDD